MEKKAAIGNKGYKNPFFISTYDSRGTHTTFYKMKSGKIKKVKTADYLKERGKYRINGEKVKGSTYRKLFKGYSKTVYK